MAIASGRNCQRSRFGIPEEVREYGSWEDGSQKAERTDAAKREFDSAHSPERAVGSLSRQRWNPIGVTVL